MKDHAGGAKLATQTRQLLLRFIAGTGLGVTRNEEKSELTFAELNAATCTAKTRFLTLFHTRVAGQVTAIAKGFMK